MENDYCLVVGLNRLSAQGPGPQYISFFGDHDGLRRIANAAFELGYVQEVRIHAKTGANTRVKWTKTALLMKRKERVGESYSNEEELENDLRREIGDDQLFDSVYGTRRDVLGNSQSGRITIKSD